MDQQKRISIRFFLWFAISFTVFLLFIQPYLWLKLSLVRFFLKIWLGPVAPYVRPIPYYKGINLQYPLFLALSWFLPVQNRKNTSLIKQVLLTLLGLIILLLIDSLVSGWEIGSQTLSHPSGLLSFLIVFSLSIGPVVFPLLVWFILLYPTQSRFSVDTPKSSATKRSIPDKTRHYSR